MNRGGEAYLNVTDDLRIRAYLLGQLGEAERDSLEAHLLGDVAFGELAEAVEAELMDSYVAGELRRFEKVQWESYMVAHPAARSRLALARGLDRRFGGGRRRSWWWMGGLAAAAVVMVCFWVMQRPERGPVVVPEPAVMAVVLTPGGVRGEAGPQMVRIGPYVEAVRFTWKGVAGAATVSIRNVDSGAVVWTGEASAPVLSVRLNTGDHVATVRDRAGVEIADFVFMVSNP